MSQSNKPLATTEEYAPGKTGVVAPSALWRRRTRSLHIDLPPSGFVASRVNNINMTSALTKNVNLTDAPNPTARPQNMQSWNDSTISEGEPERDRDSRRASAFTEQSKPRDPWPSMEDKGCNDGDRDTLPSQSQPSPTTPLSRYRPRARIVHVPRPKHLLATDDIARPLTPCATHEASNATLATSIFDMPCSKTSTENENLNNEPLGIIEPSTASTAPFYHGHRRNKTSISQMKELVPRNGLRKGVSYGTETLRAMSGQYIDGPISPQHISTANCDSELDGLSSDTVPNARALERKALPSSSSSSSTAASGNRKESDTPTLSPKTTLEKSKEHERTPSSESTSSSSTVASKSWNVFDPETFPPIKEASSPPAENFQRTLRRVEKFSRIEKFNFEKDSFSQHDLPTTLFDMDWTEVRQMYPLEAFVLASAEDGCAVLDWACPWPPEKPAKKLLRFASRADFAPSVHYKSDSEGSADSNASLYNLVDIGEYRAEYRKSTLHFVNVPDQAQDDGFAMLAPLTYNAAADDEITTLLPFTHNASAGDEMTTLLPLTYNATPGDTNESLLSIRRKPIPQEVEDKSRRSSAPAAVSQNEVDDKDENADDDDDGGSWARCRVDVSPGVVARSVRYRNLDDRDADIEQINIEKKHKRGGSTGLLNHVSKSVDKFVESYSDADTVKEPTPANTINRRPLPAHTGILDRDFQFPAPDQNKRGVSMPTFPLPLSKGSEERKHTRRSSFGKLLNAFGKKDEGSEKISTKDKSKKSLGRRISQSVGRRFSSLWPK